MKEYDDNTNVTTEQQADVLHDESLVAQSDEREEKIKTLEAEKEALLDRLARLQAEFENFRKRSARESADFREYALSENARSLLPVLDNFDLALRAEGPDAELRKGVELIRRQLEDALAKAGVTPVEAVGREFDPRFHEAIEMLETSDAPDNHVIEELQRGYKLKDRLLRPARVRVAKRR